MLESESECVNLCVVDVFLENGFSGGSGEESPKLN